MAIPALVAPNQALKAASKPSEAVRRQLQPSCRRTQHVGECHCSKPASLTSCQHLSVLCQFVYRATQGLIVAPRVHGTELEVILLSNTIGHSSLGNPAFTHTKPQLNCGSNHPWSRTADLSLLEGVSLTAARCSSSDKKNMVNSISSAVIRRHKCIAYQGYLLVAEWQNLRSGAIARLLSRIDGRGRVCHDRGPRSSRSIHLCMESSSQWF